MYTVPIRGPQGTKESLTYRLIDAISQPSRGLGYPMVRWMNESPHRNGIIARDAGRLPCGYAYYVVDGRKINVVRMNAAIEPAVSTLLNLLPSGKQSIDSVIITSDQTNVNDWLRHNGFRATAAVRDQDGQLLITMRKVR